jgi:hypothetical protein
VKTRYAADDTDSIAQRLKEIEAEKAARINGISLEDPQPTEAPADIDWTGVFGHPVSFYPGETVTIPTAYGQPDLVIEWDGIKWTNSSQTPFK